MNHGATALIIRGLAGAALVIGCVLPVLSLFTLGVGGSTTQLMSLPLGLLFRSVLLAATVTVLAGLIGVPMGVVIAKSGLAGRRLVFLLHLFPLFLPPFLVALGWFYLLNGALGARAMSGLFFSPMALVLIQALTFSPVITALTVLGLSSLNPNLEEAALTVSPPGRVLRLISLPLAWPSIALGALIVFSLSLSEVSVPMFLRVRTYPGAVFARLGSFDFAPQEAVLLVMPLLLLALVLAFADRWLLKRGSSVAITPHPSPPLVPKLPKWVSVLTWVFTLSALSPLLALAVTATPAGVLEALSWTGQSVSTSLLISTLSATLIVSVGLVIAHAHTRGSEIAGLLESVSMFGFFVPAAVLGLGLVATWNHSVTQVIYSSSTVLIFGLFARYSFIGLRAISAVLRRTPASYEEAAVVAGASYLQRLGGIIVPLHRRSLLLVWLLVVVFALRDLDTVISFYPPGLEPLPVRIFTLEANGPPTVVAGLSVLQIGLTAALVTMGGALLQWRRT